MNSLIIVGKSQVLLQKNSDYAQVFLSFKNEHGQFCFVLIRKEVSLIHDIF